MRKIETIAENMTKELLTIRWNQSVEEAFRVMEENSIRHLPVVDQEGFVIGILSARDVSRVSDPGRPGLARQAQVADVMSWPAITVDENLALREVVEGMIDEKVSAFLVTRAGSEVVGIVTTEDLLRLLGKFLTTQKEKRMSLKTLPYTPIVREALREIEAAGI